MKKIVAFDFDGTLVKGESFFYFLLFCNKWGFLKALPALLAYSFLRDRTRLKEALMRSSFGGIPYEKLRLQGEIFYHKWVVPRLKEKVVEALERHREEGDYLVMVSANIPPVLLPVVEQLGFNLLLCSELEVKEGKVTGSLSSPNCRGSEKVKRLEALLEKDTILEAYGNSEGDRELLEKAQISHWIT